ncbi:MAG: hypothetical protein LC802_15325 [Acidobacteria bacterium]|nr:hypothetical protein [Acidobacteriota bacterium]
MDDTHCKGPSPADVASKSPLKSWRLARALLVLACAALACGDARGQDDAARLQEDGAPPPMRYLPEEARARLSAARDLKSRTRLSLELAEERIALADGHVTADRFEEATRELGIYEALIKDAINHVQGSGPVDNKRRDQYKRIELALRAHVPRIEGIRRNLPSQNAVYARATLDFIRGLRTEALNAFYDDTVLREPPPPSKKESEKEPRAGERATGAPTPPAPENEKKPER